MGCDIYAILQRKEGEHWETLIKTFDICRDRPLFKILSNVGGDEYGFAIATSGLPHDLDVEARGEGRFHDDTFLGEHDFGHITLKKFCEAKIHVEPQRTNRMVVERLECNDGVKIIFPPGDEDELHTFRVLRRAFRYMFFDLENYRLVFGYSG